MMLMPPMFRRVMQRVALVQHVGVVLCRRLLRCECETTGPLGLSDHNLPKPED
jgi:hypothetical protein